MLEPGYALDEERRRIVLTAIRQVCVCRAWTLIAAHVRMSHVHAVVAADVFPEIAMQEEDVAGAVHYVIDGQGEPMATYLNTVP